FFATLGLALFASPFTQSFDAVLTRLFPPRIRRVFAALLTDPLIVTLAALVFTLPLTMLYFGQVSPLVLLVNLLIIPVQPLLLLLGIAATLTAVIAPPLAQILYWLDLLPLSWTIGVVRLFAQAPTLEVFVSPNLVAVFFLVILGVAMIKAVQPRWSVPLTRLLYQRALAAATALSGAGIAVLIALLILTTRPDGLLHLWLLDMGGGNAILIQTPRGAHLLIDGGRFPSRLLTALGDRLPFTDRTLEMVFLTQPDEQQFSALPAVLARYTPGVVLSTGQPNLGDAFAALQTQLSPYPLVTVRSGYSVETDDGLRVEALNPPSQPALGAPLDDSALVLRLTYGDVSFLLMPGLSRKKQGELIASGQNLHAAVIQIPSGIDPAFLDAVQPQVAITQRENPNPDELAKLGNVPLYRTDLGGTIHLSSDGRSLQIVQDRPSASS
ncbi:MAG: ComEC/Rec2 family competence protein, partial [Chloroflexota bacterium]